jgi:hypothetical protein
MSDSADRDSGMSRPDLLPRIALLLGAALAFGGIAYQMLLQAPLLAEEAGNIVRSLWYVGGQVAPYTTADATAQMPLYLYVLGFWQQFVDIGPGPSRALSVGLGVVNGLLLFLICRRLTANTLASAAAVLIFLATPATAVYFAAATPAALASMLHLAAVWLIVANLGHPRPLATAAMGILCAAMFFTRQNMLLSVIVVAPLYVAGIGKKRAAHAALLIASFAAVAALLILSFPERLHLYALRLPLITSVLESMGVVAPNFMLIDRGTVAGTVMGPAFERIAPADFIDGFLLPYSGTLILALLLFVLAGRNLRVLWIAPLYFLFLVLAHYLGSQGYCPRCIAVYAPYFSAIGALSAAVALALLAHRARQKHIAGAPMILIGATLAVALNAFAPMLALRADDKGFPLPLLASATPSSEAADAAAFARWINANTPAREPILVLHGLGARSVPSLPYAVYLSEHPFPAQSINPAASRRTINPRLGGAAREAVQAALEEESLWSEATLARWLDRDYDFVLFQMDPAIDQKTLLAALDARFDLIGAALYRGATVRLYRRKSVQ